MHGSLNFNLAQWEDQRHMAVKRFILKLDTPDIGQLWDCAVLIV
jgi:hypothetical protein